MIYKSYVINCEPNITYNFYVEIVSKMILISFIYIYNIHTYIFLITIHDVIRKNRISMYMGTDIYKYMSLSVLSGRLAT